MKPQYHNNKRIIWENKTSQILLILVSLLFVVVSLWAKDRISIFIFWGSILLFGIGGLLSLIRLLNSKNIFVNDGTPLAGQIHSEQFQKILNDPGFFTYNEDGFSLQQHKGITHYKWGTIQALFGYKEDLFTTDEICLDIFMVDNLYIKLTESTPGWYQFNKRLSENIPEVQVDWYGEIVLPPFETKLTLLFDKKGRTKENAEKEFYKE